MKIKLNVETDLKEQIYERAMEKLGYHETPVPCLKSLNRIFRSWCQLVGYDNIRNHIDIEKFLEGHIAEIDPNNFLINWVRHGISGPCWPASEALFGLLVWAGYHPERIAGQMRGCNDQMNPNHGALIVHLGKRKYYVDPTMASGNVLELKQGNSTNIDNKAFGIWSMGDGGIWWRPGHSRQAIEAEMKLRGLSNDFYCYRYQKTIEISLFNTGLYIRRNQGEGLVTYSGGKIFRVDKLGNVTIESVEDFDIPTFFTESLGLSDEVVTQMSVTDTKEL